MWIPVVHKIEAREGNVSFMQPENHQHETRKNAYTERDAVTDTSNNWT